MLISLPAHCPLWNPLFFSPMEVWQSCPVWSNQLTLPCWNQPYQQGLERKRCIIWSLKGTKSKPAALKSSGCGMPASPIKPQTTASWLPRSTMPRPSSVTSHLSKMHNNIRAKMYHLFSLLSSARTICWGRARRLLMAPTTFWCSQPHLKQKNYLIFCSFAAKPFTFQPVGNLWQEALAPMLQAPEV